MLNKHRSSVHDRPSFPVNNKPPASSSKFWCFLYVLIVGWIVFLFSFHYLSLQPLTNNDQTNSQQPTNTAVTEPLSSKTLRINPVPTPNTPKQIALTEPATDDDLIHIVFSTDCSFFQDWQTLLVFHSAMIIHQKGKITRIASGCSEDKQKELTTLYATLFPQYSVHFTPDFKTDGKTKKKYDFYNKPYGLHHWLLNANPSIPEHTVIVLLDPDMILLRPFTLNFANNTLNIFMDGYDLNKEHLPKKLGRGYPAAQLYGLGAPWATDRPHKHFNRREICGDGSPCLNVKQRFGELHYSVGPPYLVEKNDMLRITQSWTDFVPKVYSNYPELLAEMYAYSMAAAHQDLPHYTLIHYMVSNVDVDEEGWKYIDVFNDDVCEEPVNGIFYPNHDLPNVLHHCQFFRSGEYGFQKRRIRKSIFQCDQPMMAHLPKDLGKNRFKNRDGEIIKMGPKASRRNAFMLCTIHRAINAMVRYYKSKMCQDASFVNYNETINLVAMKY